MAQIKGAGTVSRKQGNFVFLSLTCFAFKCRKTVKNTVDLSCYLLKFPKQNGYRPVVISLDLSYFPGKTTEIVVPKSIRSKSHMKLASFKESKFSK